MSQQHEVRLQGNVRQVRYLIRGDDVEVSHALGRKTPEHMHWQR